MFIVTFVLSVGATPVYDNKYWLGAGFKMVSVNGVVFVHSIKSNTLILSVVIK